MKPKLIRAIYTCGPLEGRNQLEAFGWRDIATKYLKKYGIECYNPGEDTTLNDAHTVCKLDALMIDNSDALLVNLTCLGEDRPTNTGTLIEIGKAWEQGKLIVGFSYAEWKRENRFLRGIVNPIFFSINGQSKDALTLALEYVAGYNNRKRSQFV